MGRICIGGVFDELVDCFSEPLYRPSEAEVGLCGSWQRCPGYGSVMTGSLVVGDSISNQYRGRRFVGKMMTEQANFCRNWSPRRP